MLFLSATLLMINVLFWGVGNWWANSKRFSKGAYIGQRHSAKIYGLYSFGTFFTKFRLLAKWARSLIYIYIYKRTDKSEVTQARSECIISKGGGWGAIHCIALH